MKRIIQCVATAVAVVAILFVFFAAKRVAQKGLERGALTKQQREMVSTELSASILESIATADTNSNPIKIIIARHSTNVVWITNVVTVTNIVARDTIDAFHNGVEAGSQVYADYIDVAKRTGRLPDMSNFVATLHRDAMTFWTNHVQSNQSNTLNPFKTGKVVDPDRPQSFWFTNDKALRRGHQSYHGAFQNE